MAYKEEQFIHEVEWRLGELEMRFNRADTDSRAVSDSSESMRRILREAKILLGTLVDRSSEFRGEKIDKVRVNLRTLLSAVDTELSWWQTKAVEAAERGEIIQMMRHAIREIITECVPDYKWDTEED